MGNSLSLESKESERGKERISYAITYDLTKKNLAARAGKGLEV